MSVASGGVDINLPSNQLSKSFESRVRASIVKLLQEKDLNVLTTRMIRQSLENEFHMNLKSMTHKIIIKRIAHEEIQKLSRTLKKKSQTPPQHPNRAAKSGKFTQASTASTASNLQSEDTTKRKKRPATSTSIASISPKIKRTKNHLSWKQKDREKVIEQALAKLMDFLHESPQQFEWEAMNVLHSLFDLQAICGESRPLFKRAVVYAEEICWRWLTDRCGEALEPGSTSKIPSSDELECTQLADVAFTQYALQRAHVEIPHQVHNTELITKARSMSTEMTLSWGNISKLPSTFSQFEDSVFVFLTNALIRCFYLHHAGLDMDNVIRKVYGWVLKMYPLKKHSEISHDEFERQCDMVVSVVMVFSNFGTLRLDPELFAHENAFIREQLKYHVRSRNTKLVADFVQALNVFGLSENDSILRQGLAYLLDVQSSLAFNSRDTKPSQQEIQCEELLSIMLALIPNPLYTGYGPCFTSILPDLQQQVNRMETQNGSAGTGTTIEPGTASNTGSESGSDPTAKSKEVPIAKAKGPKPEGSSSSPGSNRGTDTASIINEVKRGLEEKGKGGDIRSLGTEVVRNALEKLIPLEISMQLLKETGIGKVVNKLKKHRDAKLASMAQDLVSKWKRTMGIQN